LGKGSAFISNKSIKSPKDDQSKTLAWRELPRISLLIGQARFASYETQPKPALQAAQPLFSSLSEIRKAVAALTTSYSLAVQTFN
jgi:hypothetical protein